VDSDSEQAQPKQVWTSEQLEWVGELLGTGPVEPLRALRTSATQWAEWAGTQAEREELLASIHANCPSVPDCCDRDEEWGNPYCPSHSLLYSAESLAWLLATRRARRLWIPMEHLPS